MHVAALASKHLIRENFHVKVDVAAFPPVLPGTAFAGNPDASPVLDSGGNFHVDGAALGLRSGS